MTVDVWMLVVAVAAPLLLIGIPGLVGYGKLGSRTEAAEKAIEKLDRDKASKEFADGLKGQISSLKSEIDKRFDHLEELLRNGR